MVSDRASNYFVTGEDDMKPGSMPGDTLTRTWICLLLREMVSNTLSENVLLTIFISELIPIPLRILTESNVKVSKTIGMITVNIWR
jgi:hypothetical protein